MRRLSESGVEQIEIVSGQVTEVEDIEPFGDDPKFIFLANSEALGEPDILSREVVAQVELRRQRDGRIRIPVGILGARNFGIVRRYEIPQSALRRLQSR